MCRNHSSEHTNIGGLHNFHAFLNENSHILNTPVHCAHRKVALNHSINTRMCTEGCPWAFVSSGCIDRWGLHRLINALCQENRGKLSTRINAVPFDTRWVNSLAGTAGQVLTQYPLHCTHGGKLDWIPPGLSLYNWGGALYQIATMKHARPFQSQIPSTTETLPQRASDESSTIAHHSVSLLLNQPAACALPSTPSNPTPGQATTSMETTCFDTLALSHGRSLNKI